MNPIFRLFGVFCFAFFSLPAVWRVVRPKIWTYKQRRGKASTHWNCPGCSDNVHTDVAPWEKLQCGGCGSWMRRRKDNCQSAFGFFVALCSQPSGAPFIDRGGTNETVAPYRHGSCRVVLLAPWRRNQHGDRLGGKAIAIGRWVKPKRAMGGSSHGASCQ